MKKKELEMALSRLERFEEPKEALEQYNTPPDIVADILLYAYMQGNIEGKTVADFGCGAGIIALGCSLLGAKKAFGIEVDDKALAVAKRNEQKLREDGFDVAVEWVHMDVADFNTPVDTVVQNPPFGIKRKNYDRIFLAKAIEAAPVVYSIHRAAEGTASFINGFAQRLGAYVASVKAYSFGLPKAFYHHRSNMRRIGVECYLIMRGVGHETERDKIRGQAAGI